MNRALRFGLLLVFLLAGALMMLLAAASSSSSAFDRYYPWLIGANGMVATLVAALAIWVVLRVWRGWRRRVFGAQIMVRLAIAFALIGAVPVALVSFISAQFLAKTIDTWFNQSVNTALESGVSLGRASLDAIQSDAMSKARRLALAIEDVPASKMIAAIEKVVDTREGVDVLVLSGSGRVLASRSAQLTTLVPELPPMEALNRARAARQYVTVEPLPGANDRSLQVRAIALTTRVLEVGDETRFVQWVEQIPPGLTKNLEALNDGVRDYQQLALGKQGLRKIYGVTLLLTLLLAFFGALLSAVLLSSWLAGPLRQLERATKAVGSGDYRPLRFDPKSTDELNVLVGSFNEMTAQLTEARELAQKSRLRLEESNLFLQQVLAHLTAGVMVMDAQWRLVDFNASAERILGIKLADQKLATLGSISVLGGCAQQMEKGLAAGEDIQFQHETVLQDGSVLTLLVSGSRLPGKMPQYVQYVVIFDDIGELLSAQRSRDFAEMARRLAHEIKNPLTPIQLSAERLERRLLDRLAADDAELLSKSTQTIVDQVNALKAMVDEFRNYARLPAPNPEPVNLARLFSEMQTLYATDKRIQWPTPAADFWVWVDRTQLIQVVHNLIQNAQDAVSEKSGHSAADTLGAAPDSSVGGRIRLVIDEVTPGPVGAAGAAESKASRRIRLAVIDNGPGIAPEVKTRLFEPYFTSKTKGSGLGLAIVKKIVEENGGKVTLTNRSDIWPDDGPGAVALVEFAKLDKATDNSVVQVTTHTAHG